MNTKLMEGIAVIESDTPVILDVQSALDLITAIGYENNICKLAIAKSAINEDFFKLSSGFAGDVAQKFVQYGFQVAIFGDFSHYASKPLRNYMYECNNGKHLFFVEREEEAVARLSSC